MIYFFTPQRIAEARLHFQQLEIAGPESGDRFFEAFGIGNTIEAADRPYERFNDYELLLQVIQKDDPKKYLDLHKGTAYYFLAWTAFDLRDYERAVFYMDAALSEDERKFPVPFEEWIKNPSGQFLSLEPEGNQAASRVTAQFREILKKEFDRFGRFSPFPKLDIDFFVHRFVRNLAQKRENRSIITALYGFILEFCDRHQMLNLRSMAGGSIEPMLAHLFKGGLIFESLLKRLYSGKTLGEIGRKRAFQADFPRFSTSAVSLKKILHGISDNSVQTAFNTTVKLRNTTGHNLVWDDIFNDPRNFQELYEQIINALCFVIQKKYI